MPHPFSTFTAGPDYMETFAMEFFSNGSVTGDTVCVYVPLIDDDNFEKTEYFYVHIVGVEENVVVHVSYASVHIYDNDSTFLIFIAISLYLICLCVWTLYWTELQRSINKWVLP